MNIRSLFKFSFIWNFQNKKGVVFSLTTFGALKYDYDTNTREAYNFLPLIRKSVVIL